MRTFCIEFCENMTGNNNRKQDIPIPTTENDHCKKKKKIQKKL